MKMSRRILGVVLSIIMIISAVPFVGFADSVVEIYNGNQQVTEIIHLQEYRSAELTAVLSESLPEGCTVAWSSNLPLLADVDDEGRVTAYDYSKSAVIRLWIDENIASLPIIGTSLAEEIWEIIESSGIDLDNTDTDTLVDIVSAVVGDALGESLRDYLDNMNVKITAVVYDEDGKALGSDTVEVLVEKSLIASVAPTSVHITNKKVVPLTVAVGSTVQLYGACTPVRLGQGVRWTVGSGVLDLNASDYASVSGDGLVTFKKPGTVTVRVNPENVLYAAFTDYITFTVLSQEDYPVTDFTINGNASVQEGSTVQLSVSDIEPAGAYWGDLTWTSADPEIATVDENGFVTGLDGGSGLAYSRQTVITAQIGSVIKEYPIKVVRSVVGSLSSVEISGNTSVGVGLSETLVADVLPARLNTSLLVSREWGIYDEHTDSITYASKNSPAVGSFISVDENGVVTGIASGVTKVFVKASYGTSVVYDSVDIVSGKAVTDFEITGTLRVNEGETTALSVNVLAPEDYEEALLDSVIWSVSDETVATISDDGKVYGRDAGGRLGTYSKTVTVTAEISGVIRSVNVSVRGPGGLTNKYTNASVNGNDYVIVDFPRQFTSTSYPSRINSSIRYWGLNTDEGAAPWNINDLVITSINQQNANASIDSNGIVTGIEAGEVEVYSYLSNIVSEIDAKKTVNIVEIKPASITITAPTKYEYLEGETELDLTGLEVYVKYNRDDIARFYPDAASLTDEQLTVKVEDYTVKEPNLEVFDAEQYIVVSLERAGENVNAVFPIYISSKAVESIDVTAPEKYEYFEGDMELDLTGLAVTANYENADSEPVDSYYIDYSSFDFELYDVEQNVRVVYEHAGRSAEGFFPIIIYGKPVLSVETDYESGVWTPENVTFELSLTHGLEGAVFYYKTSLTGSWTALASSTLTLTNNQNAIYYFKGVNSHGLESEVSEGIDVKIDKQTPFFTASPTMYGFTNRAFNVSVTNKSIGASGFKSLTLNGEEIGNVGAFTVNENGDYTLVLTANNGLSYEYTVTITNIDTEAPEITAVNLTQAPDDAPSRLVNTEKFAKYFSGNVAARVTVLDRGTSGVSKIKYRMTDEAYEPLTDWLDYDEQTGAVCSENFTGYFEFYAVDKAGNIGASVYSDGFVRDGQIPVITNVSATCKGQPYENGSWVDGAVRFTPEAAAYSGIYEYFCRVDDGEWRKFTEDYIEVDDDGSHEYFFKAVSLSGLESEVYSFVVNIDRTVPLIRVDFEGTFGRWTCEDVKFTLSTLNVCPSGAYYYYDCGAGWKPIDGNIACFTENGAAYYRFKAVNGAGLESAPSDSYNVKIDTVEPTAYIIQSETEKTATPYDIAIVPVTGESGVRKVYFDGEDVTETLTATVSRNGRYILTVVGNNLLSSTQVITIKNFGILPQTLYSYTFIDENRANVISYNGKEEVVTVPYDIDNHSIVELASGAFLDKHFVKEINIQNGFEKIGNVCFKNCTSLEKITIPYTVTEIGAYAFDGCSDFTIYCYENSYAHTYAVENNIPFVLLEIKPIGKTEVDYENGIIYTDIMGGTDVSQFVSTDGGYHIIGVPSTVIGETEVYGTGALIYFFKDGKLIYTYKLAVRGDLDGDSYVDALDVALGESAANEHIYLFDDFVTAADFDFSGGVEDVDYQCIVNAALWS